MAAAAAFLVRGGALLFRPPILRAAAPSRCCYTVAAGLSTAVDPSQPPPENHAFSTSSENTDATPSVSISSTAAARDPQKPPPPPPSSLWKDGSDYRRWKDRETEILKDIESITFLAKDIIHSNRYMDGERLNAEDEKAVVEKLLIHHPHSEDKIGCGLDSIMVDRHPQFRNSRCLFVVRTDGGWIDFSYQKCLRAYIQDKYPTYAERFIREHFRRT